MIHVTTTCDTMQTARDLAARALEARLCACANAVPGVVSLFHWQGAVADETEVQITFKTGAAQREALVALLQEAHPYDLPVITWEEVGATDAAEAWLAGETGGPAA